MQQITDAKVVRTAPEEEHGHKHLWPRDAFRFFIIMYFCAQRPVTFAEQDDDRSNNSRTTRTERQRTTTITTHPRRQRREQEQDVEIRRVLKPLQR